MHMQLHFEIYHNGPNDPKGNEYNLQYGDVRGDVLPLPHALTPAAV